MNCPICKSKLIITRTNDVGHSKLKVSRLRVCPAPGCGYRSFTDEILPEYYSTDEGRIELMQLQKYIQKVT